MEYVSLFNVVKYIKHIYFLNKWNQFNVLAHVLLTTDWSV